jgi:hypothetical protein
MKVDDSGFVVYGKIMKEKMEYPLARDSIYS